MSDFARSRPRLAPPACLPADWAAMTQAARLEATIRRLNHPLIRRVEKRAGVQWAAADPDRLEALFRRATQCIEDRQAKTPAGLRTPY